MNKKIKILVPDGEENLLYQAIFALSNQINFEIHVLSRVKKKPMRYSRYVKAFRYCVTNTHEEWIANLNEYVSQHNIDIVLPVGQEATKALINYKHLVLHPHKLVYLTDKENYIFAIDKAALSKHLVKNNIPHPKTWIIKSNSKWPKNDELKFPMIIKPADGIDGQGIHVFKNSEDLNIFINAKMKPITYVLQEYIYGYDIDCSVLCKNGEVLYYTIQKGILFENRKFAPAIGLQFLDNEALITIVKRLIKSADWSGLAHIDLRYDDQEQTFKIIEINGRVWGSLDASCKAGINFLELYCKEALGLTLPNYRYSKIQYFNLKGYVKTIVNDPRLLFNWSFNKNQTPIFYCFKDPLPIFFRYIHRTTVLLRKRLLPGSQSSLSLLISKFKPRAQAVK